MFAAWLLPRFVLQALRVGAQERVGVLDEVPSAGASRREGAPLICVTERAEREGARAGQTVSQAQARCPQLRVMYRDERAEQQVQEHLLQAAESWTPDYESTQPGACLLNLRKARWNDGRCWMERGLLMREQVRELGYECRVGLAENADLALLAAHSADPVRVLRAGVAEEKRLLHALPVVALAPSADMLEVLRLWGVGTLGQLAALPRQDIGRRLGREGLHLWDLAHGGKERLLRLVRPVQVFREEAELEAPIECLEPLMHLLERQARQLCTRLASTWRVAGQLHLTLRFDDKTSHQRELRVAEPTRDVGVLLRVLEACLEGFTAAAPIVCVALEITPVRAASTQATLFDRGLRDPNRFAETLSALEALLGKGNAGRAELIPTHLPDAVRVAPFLEDPAAASLAGAGLRHGLPLRRFRPPRPVQMVLRHSAPASLCLDGKTQSIIARQGPWLLSGHWWDVALQWQQEAWDVATEDGGLYRLVLQQGRWQVEGVYG